MAPACLVGGLVRVRRVLDVGEEGIFMKPTSVGLLSTFSFRLQNETRVPLAYHLVLPDHLREVFTVSPVMGRLKGKETERIQVRTTTTPPEADDQWRTEEAAEALPAVGGCERHHLKCLPLGSRISSMYCLLPCRSRSCLPVSACTA